MRQLFIACRFRQLLFASSIIIIYTCIGCSNHLTERGHDVTITIVSADTATGDLVLSVNDTILKNSKDDTVWVYSEKKVKWIRAQDVKDVLKKIGIEIKTDSEDIFKKANRPQSKPTGDEAEGRIREIKGDKPVVCIYSIVWKGKNGKEYKFDPKIAVMPSDAVMSSD